MESLWWRDWQPRQPHPASSIPPFSSPAAAWLVGSCSPPVVLTLTNQGSSWTDFESQHHANRNKTRSLTPPTKKKRTKQTHTHTHNSATAPATFQRPSRGATQRSRWESPGPWIWWCAFSSKDGIWRRPFWAADWSDIFLFHFLSLPTININKVLKCPKIIPARGPKQCVVRKRKRGKDLKSSVAAS